MFTAFRKTQGQRKVIYPAFGDATNYLPSSHIKCTLIKMTEGKWRIWRAKCLVS